jgi:hypothetical protein
MQQRLHWLDYDPVAFAAGCRYGYDCTARIEHLSQPEPDAEFSCGRPFGPFVTML